MQSVVAAWVDALVHASPEFLAAQCFSFVAVIMHVISGQMEKPQTMMRLSAVAAAGMVIHYALIGAVVAAAIASVSAMRSFLMSTDAGRRYKKIVMPLCVSLAVINGTLLAQEPWMLVCLGGPIIWGVAEYIGDEKVMRPLGVISTSFWLFNNVMAVSVGGVIVNLMVMSSYAIATLRQMKPFSLRREPVVVTQQAAI